MVTAKEAGRKTVEADQMSLSRGLRHIWWSIEAQIVMGNGSAHIHHTYIEPSDLDKMRELGYTVTESILSCHVSGEHRCRRRDA